VVVKVGIDTGDSVKVLFIHQNFPGQFKFLAPELVDKGYKVYALIPPTAGVKTWRGVTLLNYEIERGNSPGIHEWLIDFESKTIRAEALYRAALKYRDDGFAPDVIVAHPGWGESLLVKEVWPDAKLGIYCEFYYQAEGLDVGFDPEFTKDDPAEAGRLAWKNINNLLHIQNADAAICPTVWQASTYPTSFREKMSICHEGIDTASITPNTEVSVVLGDGTRLSAGDPVVTFVSRSLEPYRGFHTFMRSLPELLSNCPTTTVIIIGDESKGYGELPTSGHSWKMLLAQEINAAMTPEQWDRIHFLGRIPHDQFLAVLQVASVHVYLTYPFVLSWSLLEAMSVGCAVVGSRTGPVMEVITDEKNGRLVDFFDPSQLSQQICHLLNSPSERSRLGAAARSFVRDNYDLRSKCLPRQIEWIERLANA